LFCFICGVVLRLISGKTGYDLWPGGVDACR